MYWGVLNLTNSCNFDRWSYNVDDMLQIYRYLGLYDKIIQVNNSKYELEYYIPDGKSPYKKNEWLYVSWIKLITIFPDAIIIKHDTRVGRSDFWWCILENNEQNINNIKELGKCM